jgi:hypothetical protein
VFALPVAAVRDVGGVGPDLPSGRTPACPPTDRPRPGSGPPGPTRSGDRPGPRAPHPATVLDEPGDRFVAVPPHFGHKGAERHYRHNCPDARNQRDQSPRGHDPGVTVEIGPETEVPERLESDHEQPPLTGSGTSDPIRSPAPWANPSGADPSTTGWLRVRVRPRKLRHRMRTHLRRMRPSSSSSRRLSQPCRRSAG